MNYRTRATFIFVFLLAVVVVAFGQQSGGILRGVVTDESGALIPAATLTITDASGARREVQTGASGTFTVNGLAPGKYTVRLTIAGFVPYENTVELGAGRTAELSISLNVQAEKQQVTVSGEPGPQVSTDPSSNAGALVLRGADLDALSDDPDDLAADLQALAGPSAGPNGGQIFIDGFTGGRLPPKESIREIRINQNPFSAEYEKLGYGRIEILTKPGTDKFHGSAFFNFGDAIFNARNPYLWDKPEYISKMYGGVFSGPISKRSSFSFDVEKRDIDDNAAVSATILDPNFNIMRFSEGVVTPNRRTSISPRIDYQLSQNHTLVGRYSYSRIGQDNSGIGQFSLPSRAFDMRDTEQRLQLTETAIVGPRLVNETRLQFLHNNVHDFGDSTLPAINVLEAFNGGGAQIGNTYNRQKHWEIGNYSTTTRRTHTLRFGARVRTDSITDVSPNNFGGTFTFGGGTGPQLDASNQVVRDAATGQPVIVPLTSIERYRRTLLFQQQGLAAADIRALGGGATQFGISAGNPGAVVRQTDLGAFVQDDWRVKPNFTLSAGLRYETQTNIHDWRDFAPRIGFAFAPGAKGGRPGKTVLRGGFGMFYDRFGETYTLQALRFNGLNTQRYIVNNPDFFPNVPPVAALNAQAQTQSITRVDQRLRAPYIVQSAIGIERQLPFNTTIASTFTNSHGIHMLRSRDINAPIVRGGPRPYGSLGEIFLYESTGILNQSQWITNVNSRVNRNVSLFAFYVLNYARSDTDGVGSFPADQYNLTGEYGRSSLDNRHRFMMGGSITAPKAIRFSPFVIAASGRPFNITTGRDQNGDSLFTDRPAFATDLTRPGVMVTRFGAFDPNPLPGAVLIPRNYGEGPGQFTVNLRISRTFGFGPTRTGYRPDSMMGGGRGDHDHGEGGRGGGGPRGGGGGPHGGGPTGMRMGGGGHGMMDGGGGSTEHRYNLTLSASARNLLNHVNPGPIVGNLSSPLFGVSNSLAGGFGPVSGAGNRHLEFSLRFSF